MKNRIVSISLAVMLTLSVGLVGCTSQEVPEITKYTVAISSTEGGLVATPGEDTFAYDEGTVVNLVAVAGTGYRFVSWTGDTSAIGNIDRSSTTITMHGNYEIKANFEAGPYRLTIRSTTGGSVTNPGLGTYTYDKGTIVDLMATPTSGYQFIKWTGDMATVANISAASTTVVMNSHYTITANFAIGVYDWYDLDAIRNNSGGSYVLMNDLDSATVGYKELAGPTANAGKGWEPIGSLTVDPVHDYIVNPINSFTGRLDGQRYEIRNLFINRPDEDGVGLFGCGGWGHAIENLGVVNAEVTGHIYVGGLVAENHEGTLSNSYSTGSVSGDDYVGGLVGGNRWGNSYVRDSYSTASVTGDQSVGGLAGGNWGNVSNSYSSGRVTGTGNVAGLAGGNWGSVTNSYSASSVAGRWTIGGLVGWNHVGSVINSYFTGSVIGEGTVGGLVGQHHDGTVSNSYYSYDEVLINGRNMITIGALSNEDFDQWLANNKSLDVNERLSQEDGYYLINDVSDFKELLAFGQNSSLRFRLKNDLDLGNDYNFYIPYLAGEFDGNGHRIRNLSFHSDFATQVGLFGYLASSGKVIGVSAEDVNIFGNGIVGGLVAENDGAVSDSYSTGRVGGWWCVGGLMGWTGWNGGSVSNSHYNYDEFLINGDRMIAIGALADQDFDQWLANNKSLDVNERLPKEGGYYVINNVSDFKQLLAFGQDDSLKFRLENDLDLTTEYNFYVPYLAGEFDGNGHRISNLRLRFDSVAQVGLFGYLASGGTVSGVGAENVNIAVSGGTQEVGGLVGGSSGTVSSCYSSGSVIGRNNVGGLVGWNKGSVNNCYCSGGVTGSWAVGGLMGWNYGSPDGSGTVNNSYSTGIVIGDGRIGGLVGQDGVSVGKSFWDIETSAQATSEGGTGKTTADMKNITTFSGAGWNITAVANPSTRNPAYIWNIVDGQTYPFLSWQS